MGPVAAEAIVYSAILRPYRSGSVSAVHWIGILLSVVFLGVGLAFALAGAWLVLPFLGLEILVLLVALRLNLRKGNALEAINLSRSALTVRQVDPWGRQMQYTFPPQWLQVNLVQRRSQTAELELRSHGRSLTIGRFLLPHDRIALAQALRRELSRLDRPG